MGNIQFSVENIVSRKHSKSEGLQVIPLFSLQNLALRNNHDQFSTSTNTRTNILPVSIYLHKVNNRNTRTRCEIYSKLTIKIPERRQWRRSGIFIVNSEYISHLVLVFLLLTSNM